MVAQIQGQFVPIVPRGLKFVHRNHTIKEVRCFSFYAAEFIPDVILGILTCYISFSSPKIKFLSIPTLRHN